MATKMAAGHMVFVYSQVSQAASQDGGKPSWPLQGQPLKHTPFS